MNNSPTLVIPYQTVLESEDSYYSKEKTCILCHSVPQRVDRAELLVTVDKCISVSPSTREQAVGTGPHLVDRSTTTDQEEEQMSTGVSSCNQQQKGMETDISLTPRQVAWSTNITCSHHAVHEVGSQVFYSWPERGWYGQGSVLGRGEQTPWPVE